MTRKQRQAPDALVSAIVESQISNLLDFDLLLEGADVDIQRLEVAVGGDPRLDERINTLEDRLSRAMPNDADRKLLAQYSDLLGESKMFGRVAAYRLGIEVGRRLGDVR